MEWTAQPAARRV